MGITATTGEGLTQLDRVKVYRFSAVLRQNNSGTEFYIGMDIVIVVPFPSVLSMLIVPRIFLL